MVVKPDKTASKARKSKFNMKETLESEIELDYDDVDIGNQDDVLVSVDPREEKEFPAEGEDVEENADSDNESLTNPNALLDENDNTERVVTPISLTTQSIASEDIVSFRVPQGQQMEQSQINFDSLKSNPAFQTYVQKLVTDQVNQVNQQTRSDKTPDKNPCKRGNNDNKLVKSPSDTTLYAPALKRLSLRDKEINAEHERQTLGLLFMVDDISKFIEGIRVNQPNKEHQNNQGKMMTHERRIREKL